MVINQINQIKFVQKVVLYCKLTVKKTFSSQWQMFIIFVILLVLKAVEHVVENKKSCNKLVFILKKGYSENKYLLGITKEY